MGLFEWFNRLRGTANAHVGVHPLLAAANEHLQRRDLDQGRRMLLEAVNHPEISGHRPYLSYVLRALSITWLWQDRYQEALDFFSEFIRLNPSDPDAYCGRADALWYVGQHFHAIADYSRALELDPNEIRALSARGQVFAECGEHERAVHDLDQALQELSHNSHLDGKWRAEMEAYAQSGKGLALAHLGDYARATEEFEASIARSPENAWVYYNRAQMNEHQGNREEAILNYRRALELNNPALSLPKRENTKARLRDLMGTHKPH